MENHINHLKIENFKSIHHLELEGFKKINLFIGRPNVGKSNILEALSLLSLPLLGVKMGPLPIKKTQNLIRAGNEVELFYEGNISNSITIDVGKIGCNICRSTKVLDTSIRDTDFNIIFSRTSNIKSYRFQPNVKFRSDKLDYLSVPNGQNILQILERNPRLKELYTHWFKEYGLRLVLDRASKSLKIMKDRGEEVIILPYSSIADTLQRIIFYKTAVASNENSVLLFEEPEAHAFPPYIAQFTQEVIQSQTNQFMIVTHSPVIVNDFLENARQDLAIFMVDFKDGQTVAKPLTDEQILEVHKYGIDLFFNNESYL